MRRIPPHHTSCISSQATSPTTDSPPNTDLPGATATNYLTKNEAAQVLRLSTRTLDRLVAERQINAARVGGRRLLFRREDLDGYVLKCLRESFRDSEGRWK